MALKSKKGKIERYAISLIENNRLGKTIQVLTEVAKSIRELDIKLQIEIGECEKIHDYVMYGE